MPLNSLSSFFLRNPLALLACSVFIGIAFPVLAQWFKPLLLPLIFLLFLAAILQVSFNDAVYAVVADRACWILLIWQMLILPLLLSIALKPILPPQLYLFSVIAMCAGAITGTTAFARLFNLNSALSLVAGLLGALVTPVPLYFFINVIVGERIELDLAEYAQRVVVFILLPLLLALVIRKIISVKTDELLRLKMPQVTLVLLVFFGIAVMDGVRDLYMSDPARLMSLVILAFALSIGVQLITYIALFFLGKRNAKTAAMLCAYRNMGLAAAMVGHAIGEDFFIFLGVWQFPMYILPLCLSRWYRAH